MGNLGLTHVIEKNTATLLQHLDRIADSLGRAVTSRFRIAAATGISEQSIRTAVKKLSTKGDIIALPTYCGTHYIVCSKTQKKVDANKCAACTNKSDCTTQEPAEKSPNPIKDTQGNNSDNDLKSIFQHGASELLNKFSKAKDAMLWISRFINDPASLSIIKKPTSGITKVEAAKRAGVAERTLYRWSSGKAPDGYPGLFSRSAYICFAEQYKINQQLRREVRAKNRAFSADLDNF